MAGIDNAAIAPAIRAPTMAGVGAPSEPIATTGARRLSSANGVITSYYVSALLRLAFQPPLRTPAPRSLRASGRPPKSVETDHRVCNSAVVRRGFDRCCLLGRSERAASSAATRQRAATRLLSDDARDRGGAGDAEPLHADLFHRGHRLLHRRGPAPLH